MHSYPIKIKEYLVLGNPFVSVDIPAARIFGNVTYIACDYDDCVSKVRQAAKDKDPQNRQRRKEIVRNETWDSKVEQIMAVMEKDLNKEKHLGFNPVIQKTMR